MPETSPRALFAARLAQARQLRGLSQRALGDRMGLGKEKGSSRINRYEHQVTAIGFDNLGNLAQLLDVPASYLLASDAPMADAILALSKADEGQRDALAKFISALLEDPKSFAVVDVLLEMSEQERASVLEHVKGKP
ncbi:helix-turn-helix domain-containing protein [uncultured Stenotrophomonas sp.]|uniref:helix-turn-helix domain-containing protein n=1 Tax=uncultured Stenotrophomonas sp. TaxID=165438 RepID=UPI0025E77B2A|nr:helix-turn-helix domain-containing protein [uncultured Stenotrophomonas sp.]